MTIDDVKFLTLSREQTAAYEFLCLEADTKSWLQRTLKETLPEGDLATLLADGVVLCKLVNKMFPGSIPRSHPPDSPKYKQLDNISLFCKVCTKVGIQQSVIFTPLDLYECKNMPKVLRTLEALANFVASHGFPVKWKDAQSAGSAYKFTSADLNRATMTYGANQLMNFSDAKRSGNRSRTSDEDIVSAVATMSVVHELEVGAPPPEPYQPLPPNLPTFKAREDLSDDSELSANDMEEYREKRRSAYDSDTDEDTDDSELSGEGHAKPRKKHIALDEEFPTTSDDTMRQLLLQMDKILAVQNDTTKLHIAVQNDMEQVVGHLVAQKVKDIWAEDRDGNHPIHIAVQRKHTKNLYSLIDVGSEVNHANCDGDTPLHFAVSTGRVEHVERLIAAGADVNMQNKAGNTPMHMGVERGDPRMVAALMKHGGDVTMRNKEGNTPLHFGSVLGRADTMTTLLSRAGVNTNVSNVEGNSPLHFAALKGHRDVSEQLLTYGSNVNALNNDEATPLQLAAENDHHELVKLMVERGADFSLRKNDGWSPLYTAAYRGNKPTVVYLLTRGADPDGQNAEGWTPLHAAAHNGHYAVVSAMVADWKANVNIKNAQGTTPLFHGSYTGRAKVVEFLLDHRADIELSSRGGWKPIHGAVYNEHEHIATMLLDRGANPDPPNEEIKGYAALHIAISCDRPSTDLVRLLISKRANINAQSSGLATPLHLAVFWGHLGIAKILVEAGCDMEMTNSKGRTPLALAAHYGNRDMAAYLSSRSDKPMPVFKNNKQRIVDMVTPERPPAPERFVEQQRVGFS